MPEETRVCLTVYDLAGRQVVRLLDETLPAGWHERTWERRDGAGRKVSRGIYFLRSAARAPGSGGTLAETRKLIVFD